MAGNSTSTAAFEHTQEIGGPGDWTENQARQGIGEPASSPLTEKLGRIAESVTGEMPESKRQLRDLSKIVDRAREGASEIVRRAKDVVVDSSESLTSTVRRYPVQALVAGFAIGGIMGLLVSRWNRRTT